MKQELLDELYTKATKLMESMKFSPVSDSRTLAGYIHYGRVIITPREVVMQDFDKEKIIELYLSRVRASLL